MSPCELRAFIGQTILNRSQSLDRFRFFFLRNLQFFNRFLSVDLCFIQRAFQFRALFRPIILRYAQLLG
ncbi:hypothetical protein DIE14_35300 [Burkholderia sp. Bp9017]|nr:hypothetical protein DIE14_35300 [Burkholderia sp. Bp9017]RQZ25601.1 hypothetical protein DIE13_31490 [Burkholderia sp. Bp9016]